jgi:predicted deacylase
MKILLAILCLLMALSTIPVSASAADWGPFKILEAKVEPGTKAHLSFVHKPSFIKDALDVQVFVTRGEKAGPTLCLTGAVHGDELNGVEIARAVFETSDPKTMSGTLIAVPIVNVWGFRSGNRNLADRRDLNRSFPGSANGSLAGVVAHSLFERVIRHCDALVDLHTGSADRTNIPQVRADLGNPAVVELAQRFDVGIVLAGAGPAGSLRAEANRIGVTAIIYEAGGPYRFEATEIERGIVGVTNVMEHLGMVSAAAPTPDPQRFFRRTRWVRSPGGGIFLTDLAPGAKVREGQKLGVVIDPITNARVDVVAPLPGTLVGMAYPQVVLPGMGLFHIAGLEPGAVEPAQDE